ncbi:hypothetical protein EYC98_17425 [Halieaceae bacterium IMCC14734]|uniref:FHA domain-containing protein n=1 Tax=Candidatus Litorirhabdus singularis TaxID=2518993 RepID=A0ABT3TK10_9GAMM|nr:hypothetical protein [Candidatus Litorirhabdus singularis]MCX2982645.1 hypothetical protein [Candidatus Litorirhabdus singularis]
MNEFILDLNDRNLTLWRGDQALLSSPGYCFRQADSYQFGEAAREQARLHPRSIQHRYWWQLGLEPLQPAFGAARHSADLVHQHLLQLHELGGKPDSLILAVPGSMHTEQLSLLLGIVSQCPFEVAGIVDRAIASAATVALPDHGYLLELQLHQSLITQLQQVDGQLLRGTVTPIPGCGWLALQDALANAIADTFIRQTRFDPRRKATSEQVLYDQLGSVLQQLGQHSEYNFELEGRQARLERSALEASCQPVIERITRAVPESCQRLLLDSVVASLPGSSSTFGDAHICSAEQVVQGIRLHHELITGSGADVHHITQLPAKTTAAMAATTAATAVTTAPPTAVATTTETVEPTNQVEVTAAPPQLQPTTATESGSFRLEYEAGTFTLHPGSGNLPTVNGHPLRAAMQLRAGDRVETVDGKRITIAAMETDDGPQT